MHIFYRGIDSSAGRLRPPPIPEKRNDNIPSPYTHPLNPLIIALPIKCEAWDANDARISLPPVLFIVISAEQTRTTHEQFSFTTFSGLSAPPCKPSRTMSSLSHQDELIATAKAVAAAGKGILAADESTGTIAKRVRKFSNSHPLFFPLLLRSTPQLSRIDPNQINILHVIAVREH